MAKQKETVGEVPEVIQEATEPLLSMQEFAVIKKLAQIPLSRLKHGIQSQNLTDIKKTLGDWETFLMEC